MKILSGPIFLSLLYVCSLDISLSVSSLSLFVPNLSSCIFTGQPDAFLPRDMKMLHFKTLMIYKRKHRVCFDQSLNLPLSPRAPFSPGPLPLPSPSQSSAASSTSFPSASSRHLSQGKVFSSFSFLYSLRSFKKRKMVVRAHSHTERPSAETCFIQVGWLGCVLVSVLSFILF